MAEPAPAVLVLGAAGVGKSTLVRGIAASARPLSAGGPGTEEEATGGRATTRWQIENKYYRAAVQLVEAAGPSAVESPEALLLVFSANSEASFAAARAELPGEGALEAIEVRAVVATHVDRLLPPGCGSSDAPLALDEALAAVEWLQQALEWSYANGFEFVGCCPAVPELDQALTLEGERQGVRRVVEVLHAHTWTNLERVATDGRAAGAGAAAAAAAYHPAATADEAAPAQPGSSALRGQQEEGEQASDPAMAPAPQAAAGETAAPEAAAAAAGGHLQLGDALEGGGLGGEGVGDEDEEDDEGLGKLDQLLQEMQGRPAMGRKGRSGRCA